MVRSISRVSFPIYLIHVPIILYGIRPLKGRLVLNLTVFLAEFVLFFLLVYILSLLLAKALDALPGGACARKEHR